MVWYRSNKQPRCRYCGGKIAKKTESQYFCPPQETSTGSFYDSAIKALPRNKEEAQRLINQQIVSLRYARSEKHGSYIDHVTTWDGETYVDPYFCNGEHARLLGYLMAHNGRYTTSYEAALMKDEA